MASIKQDIVQTLTREQLMKAREEDEKNVREGKVKIGVQRVVKGYNV